MTTLHYKPSLTTSDPQRTPVLIIGQIKHLTQLKWSDIKCKLEPQVTEEVFKLAVSNLHPTPIDTCPMYLNRANVAALPLKCSRHNTSSRGHSITKLVQNNLVGTDECVVIVCEKKDVYASGCAVSRAFPLYSRKTSSSDGKKEKNTVSVEFFVVPTKEVGDPELTQKELEAIEVASTGIRLTQQIVDKPCNEMNVDHFLKEVDAVGQALNIVPQIIRGEELREKGFGGIYGVGKAAEVPPALAVLSHTVPGARNTVAWVGKGIVYDTGGLSIKGKTDMVGMKRDCGGAAAILGAFYAAVKSNFTENLHAVFCLAENAVSSRSARPDDVHTMYSGQTVEINNTDAEGRLVLGDGVAFAQKDLQANIILDMATLTGAQGIATGKYHAAVLTNNEDWQDSAFEAGLNSGDLVFPIPYCPELHFSEFSSAIADMKNSVADRMNAQSSCAGLFIASHMNKSFEYPGVWLHVDMAYPVHSGERATGYGVALLTTLFGKFTKQPLLNSIAPEIEDSVTENHPKKPRKH